MSKLTNPSFGNYDANNNKAKSNTNEEKSNKYSFSLEKPEEFPAIADMAGVVTTYLGKKISKFLSGAYRDFKGCTVNVMPNGQCLDIKFIFDKTVDRGSDLPYAFTDFNKVKSSGNSLVDKINGYGNINNQKIYYPTQELKDGIERFMFGYGTPNFKPDWNKIYYEYNDTNECGMYVTRAAVTCIDIYKLLPEIYGYKDENNESYFYNVNICRPTAFINSNGNTLTMSNIDYLLSITRLNSTQIKKLASRVGIYTNINGMNIITPDDM